MASLKPLTGCLHEALRWMDILSGVCGGGGLCDMSVTACTQIRRCAITFNQIDKISTCTCIFDDAKLGKISEVTASRRDNMKYL